MSALSRLKLLVNLALIDGEVAEKERKYISNIGMANGLNEKDIKLLLEKEHEVVIPTNLNVDQKFDYVFSLVQLMKIDERLYQEEIKYCAQVAARLGYKKDVMVELMLKVSATMKQAEIDSLRAMIRNFLV